MDIQTLLFWASGSPVWGQASQKVFSNLQQDCKSCFFLASWGFYAPWTRKPPKSWESGLSEKNPPRVMLWNPQLDVIIHWRMEKDKRLGFHLPLASEAPLVGWLCPPWRALGPAWHLSSIPSHRTLLPFFQFNLSGWQLSGFGDATTSNFHMHWTATSTGYLKWWQKSYPKKMNMTTASKSIKYFITL